jgi:peroxiredoxin
MKLPRYTAPALLAVTLVVAAALAYESVGGTQAAPPVEYTLLNGAKVHSAQWKGKVMLVNFWATNCSTCVHEMPQIVATHEKFKGRGFDTVAVAMSYDPPTFVANFAESRKLPFGVAIDNTGQIARSFGEVRLTPTTLLINKRGEIVKRYVGEPDFVALHGLVEKLLAET